MDGYELFIEFSYIISNLVTIIKIQSSEDMWVLDSPHQLLKDMRVLDSPHHESIIYNNMVRSVFKYYLTSNFIFSYKSIQNINRAKIILCS